MAELATQTAGPQMDESEVAYPGWKVVFAGFFGVLVSFAAIVPYTFGLFLKPLSLSFGWHREATSAGFSIAALTVAAASPGLGFLLDRHVVGILLLSVASSLTAGLIAAGFIGFSMGSEGDITPYLLGRYFGLKRFSTLYAVTWTTYAVGGATGPILVGRVFDRLGSYRPITIQLLALPALIPCLLMFALPRYEAHGTRAQPGSGIPDPHPVEASP